MTGRVDSEAIELSGSISGSTIRIGSGAGKGVGLVEQSVVVVMLALRFLVIRTYIGHGKHLSTSLTSNSVY